MRVWLGFHPAIGVVIYDPMCQSGLEQSQVRLWDVNGQELRLFDRKKVRTRLRSLKAHLLATRLEALVLMHGIGGQIAKRYLENRPGVPSSPLTPEPTSEFLSAIDFDDDSHLLTQELSEDQDAWARSEEEGWFYEE